jgi:rhodanese-related sulfurtransferase
MKKYTIFFAVAVVIGAALFGTRFLSGEDTWLCQASAWSLHGKPSAGVPAEPCDGVETVYLDVRRDDEWSAGHVKGAIHFDLARLQAGQFPDIPKNSNLHVYCKSGVRAGMAKEILDNAGFTNVTNAGGFESLQTQGYPVE